MNHKNHNPEWCSQKQKKNNQCDCIVEVDDVDMTPGGIVTKYVIRYCPTHEQAAALQAENAKLRDNIKQAIRALECALTSGIDDEGISPAPVDCVIDDLKQALSRPPESRR